MSAKLLAQTLYIGPTDKQQMVSGPLVGIENLAQLTNKLMSFLIPIGAMATWNGDIAAGNVMPRSSKFCSIAAATMRDTPMP